MEWNHFFLVIVANVRAVRRGSCSAPVEHKTSRIPPSIDRREIQLSNKSNGFIGRSSVERLVRLVDGSTIWIHQNMILSAVFGGPAIRSFPIARGYSSSGNKMRIKKRVRQTINKHFESSITFSSICHAIEKTQTYEPIDYQQQHAKFRQMRT